MQFSLTDFFESNYKKILDQDHKFQGQINQLSSWYKNAADNSESQRMFPHWGSV